MFVYIIACVKQTGSAYGRIQDRENFLEQDARGTLTYHEL